MSPPLHVQITCPKTFCSTLDFPGHCQTQPVYLQHRQTKLLDILFQEAGDLPRYRERAIRQSECKYFSPSYLHHKGRHKKLAHWSYTFFAISSFSHTVQLQVTMKSECQRMEELGVVFVRRVTDISTMTCS